MKIGGASLGGLSGGLYELLESTGRWFFTVLLGSERANQVSLEYSAVRVGATILGGAFGSLAGLAFILISSAHWLTLLLFGCGGVLGSIVPAGVLIGYVRQLRREEVRLRPPSIKGKSLEAIREEKLQELLQRGYSRDEAEREAFWFADASFGACFIATAVFRDASCHEVEVLRAWRNTRLQALRSGRILIGCYGTIGPLGAEVVVRFPWLRPPLRRLLTRIAHFVEPRHSL